MNLIEAYRYLAALEQHRHFGRAAAACHITQPALSNALRALESHFAISIVRRGRAYEGLTPEGERVLATAHRVLREQEALQQELVASAEQPRGRLVIGAVPTAMPVAARFAGLLVARHPGITPLLRQHASQEIETGLEALAIDLGLGYTDRAPAGTRTAAQYVEHHHLLQRASGGFAIGAPIAWADAAALPLALLSPEMHNRVIVDGVFASLGIRVQPVIETNSVMALLLAVLDGSVAAVLPGALVATVAGQGGLMARPLHTPVLRTPIGFMTARGARRSLALAAALRLAEEPAWLADATRFSGALVAASISD